MYTWHKSEAKKILEFKISKNGKHIFEHRKNKSIKILFDHVDHILHILGENVRSPT